MKKKSKTTNGRYAIVANGSYGLWFGRVEATDAEIAASGRQVRVYECRGVRYWYGRRGGITSLAAHGLCGPRAGESRIGAPIPSSLLEDVKAIHDCTPEAVATFAAFTVPT